MLTVKLNELMGKNCERKEREKKTNKEEATNKRTKTETTPKPKATRSHNKLENKCLAVSMVFFNSAVITKKYLFFFYLDCSAGR